MQSPGVFLLAFFTSIVTSIGSLYVAERMQLFPRAPQQEAPTMVPRLEGLVEDAARATLENQGLVLLVDGRKPHATAAPNSVIRQSSAPGTKLSRGGVVSVTLAEVKPSVPNVVGRTVEEATRLLEQAGLELQVGETKPDATVPQGQVLAQRPAVDTALAKGETVTVDVSGGVQPSEVPNVVGLNFNTAKERIEKAGFKLKTRWVSMAETQTYVALQQEPKAGTKLEPGADVIITANRE